MGNLVKIRDISVRYNISARTLRYYEDMGLIESTRNDDYAYRLYNEAAIKRLEQILILRRLNISIKDIKRIFSTEGSEVVLDVLEKKVDNIDEEVSLLHELKKIVCCNPNFQITPNVRDYLYYINAVDKLFTCLYEDNVSGKDAYYYAAFLKLFKNTSLPISAFVQSFFLLRIYFFCNINGFLCVLGVEIRADLFRIFGSKHRSAHNNFAGDIIVVKQFYGFLH